MTMATYQDFTYVEDVVKRSGSSFVAGMKALPRVRRGYLYAIYAYCRVLDDIADETGEQTAKLNQMDSWKKKVDALCTGQPDCAITRILSDAVEIYKLPTEELYHLIDGMIADITGAAIRPNWDGLYHYCRNVAVSVGLLSLPIFGRSDAGAREFATELGYALQFTNILRDIADDDKIGRLYLPDELLQEYSVDTVQSPDLHKVLERFAIKTKEHYDLAEKHLGLIGKEQLLPAIMMKEAYHKIFRKMQARGWHKITPRMRLSVAEKAILVMEGLAKHGM